MVTTVTALTVVTVVTVVTGSTSGREGVAGVHVLRLRIVPIFGVIPKEYKQAVKLAAVNPAGPLDMRFRLCPPSKV